MRVVTEGRQRCDPPASREMKEEDEVSWLVEDKQDATIPLESSSTSSSPPVSPRKLTPPPQWTRVEDNRVRELKTRKACGGLTTDEEEELESLSMREEVFLEEGIRNLHRMCEVEIEVVMAYGLPVKPEQCRNATAEVKLREVDRNGMVSNGHRKPCKAVLKASSVTPNSDNTLDVSWGQKVVMKVPYNDALRISLFANKVVGKESLGRMDLLMSELMPKMKRGGPPVTEIRRLKSPHANQQHVPGTLGVTVQLRGYL